MTLQEAEKVGRVISQADGGACPTCVKQLITECEKYFPEFKWKYNKKYNYGENESRVRVEE